MNRVIVIERKSPGRWDYGLVSPDGTMAKAGWAVAVEMGHDVSKDEAGLWPTVLLLLRQHPTEERIEYPIDAVMWRRSEPSPTPALNTTWSRGTAGASKGGGETLRARAERRAT